MQCLNIKNPEVAKLLQEYTDILGSYNAAYYVISENNGYGLDNAPNGEPSKLFSDLLEHFDGDKLAAIQAKAKTFSNSFKERRVTLANNSNEFSSVKRIINGRFLELANRLNYRIITDESLNNFVETATKTINLVDTSDLAYATAIANISYDLMPKDIKTILSAHVLNKGLGDSKEVIIKELINIIQKKEDAKNKTKIKKVIDFILDFLERIFLNKNQFQRILGTTLSDILNPNSKFYNTVIKDGYELKTLSKEKINSLPEGETINAFLDNGFAIGGSAGLRIQGTIYRSKDEDFHDLDFVGEQNSESLKYKRLIDQYWKRYRNKEFSSIPEMREKLFDDIFNVFKTTKLYADLKKKHKVIEVIQAHDNPRNQFIVSLNVDGLGVDMFFMEDFDAKIINNIPTANFETALEFKLDVGREKDLRDIINYRVYGDSEVGSPFVTSEPSIEEVLQLLSPTAEKQYKQHANNASSEGRNDELSSLLQELYPEIEIGSLNDPTLRGQAQVEGYRAGKVLLNALLENQDTLPHEYAHHYISWFRNAAIVQNGIKLFGSEEALVQAIGENSVKALKWYNRFFNWVKGLFSKKQATLNKLTKSFLTGETLTTNITKYSEEEKHNQAVIGKTYDKLIKSTEARLRVMQHNANRDGIMTEKLQTLLSKLNVLENDKAVVEFITYMNDDVNTAFDTLRMYESQFADYKAGIGTDNPVTPEKLDLIRKGTIGFYDSLVVNLKNMLEDPEVMELYKQLGVYDSMLSRINQALTKYTDLIRRYDRLSNSIAKENLIAEAKKYGSFSIEELQEKLNEGDTDLGFWDRYVGQTQYSSSETVRLILNKISEAKYRVHDSKLAVGKRLLKLLDKVNKSDLQLFFERDSKGRKTGNITRDLNFGQHEQDYMEHMLKLLDTFGIKVPNNLHFNEIPSILNPEQLKKWNKVKNDWDGKNTERKFTKEFYDLINNLSVDALAAKNSLDTDINSILDTVRDEEGRAHREKLSDDKYDVLIRLEAARKNLSNPFNMDGSVKTGKDLEIAKEFQEYNKKLRENAHYTADKIGYEKAKAKAKKELSPEEYQKWLDRNSVDKISEKFYEDLKKLSSVSEKSEAQERYEYMRQQLIRLYNVDGKTKVTDMPDSVKKLINDLDRIIYREARKNAKAGVKSRIMEIAEWEVDPEFEKQMTWAYHNMSPSDFRVWVSKNGSFGKNGQVIPASFWKRLVPKKELRDKYIEKAPNLSWVEMDKTSPFYNKNFDPSYGMSRVPKRAKYDNSTNFNKIKGNSKVLYDALVEVMAEANSKIVFKKHHNTGQLPQIEGGALTLIQSQDNVLKGLGYMFKDTFQVKEDDPNAITDATLDPDGTGIRLVPTRFMRKLDNPNALTNDIVGSIIAYYEMATNFEEMSKIAPEMEMYLDMVGRQEFKNDRGETIRGKESNTYKKLEEMIKQFVYGMTEQDATIKMTIGNKKVEVSINKALTRIAQFTRLNGMANNLNVILTGLFTNKIQSRLDAISGIYYDNKALAKANAEIIKSYASAAANIGNANNKNKALCVLEWSGTARSSEEMFTKLNQKRWLRALNQHFWYGGFEMADYITKGKMALAVTMNYKLDPSTGKFVNKTTFYSKYQDKHEAKVKWDLLDTTLYDAFEVVDNQLQIKDKYKKNVDEVTLTRVRNTIKQVGTRIDTQLTDLDKSFVSSNVYCKLLFIYRNFLLINLQTKFITKRRYDYSTGTWQEAQFRGAWNYLYRTWINKDKAKVLQEMYQNYDELDEFERRLFKRALTEMLFSTVGLFVIALLAKGLADDDDDTEWKQLLALVAVKTSIESRSNLLPLEATNMFTSPTAAWGIFQNFYKALTTIFDNPTQIIKSGAYKGKPRWFRSLVKITPFRALYENTNSAEKRKYYDNKISMF